MPLRRKKEKFQQLTEFKRGGLLFFKKEDYPTVQKQILCSGTVPQSCEFGSSGPKSTEHFEKLAVDYGR